MRIQHRFPQNPLWPLWFVAVLLVSCLIGPVTWWLKRRRGRRLMRRRETLGEKYERIIDGALADAKWTQDEPSDRSAA